MSLDGFLTFIGLMIATYAILNPISRLRLHLQLSRQIFVAVCFLVAILFLEFFYELRTLSSGSPSWLFEFFSFGEENSVLTNNEAAFLAVLIWMPIAYIVQVVSKPRAANLGPLASLVERLHDEGKYLELIELVSPYMAIIKQADEKTLAIQRTHEWILHKHLIATNPFAAASETKPALLPNWIAKRIKPLAGLVPSRKGATNNARKILGIVTESDALRALLLNLKGEFALQIIEHDNFHRGEFTTKYLRDLFANPGSRIFNELKNNQNLASGIGYYLNPDNTLLYGLLSDPKFAIRIGVCKPVGDEALRMISRDNDYKVRLNSPVPFDDEELFDDPVFGVIFFFDIMVTTAARESYEDHMWLMYMSLIIDRIEKSFDPNAAEIDLDDEFPTLGCRLIYEAFHCLEKWVELAKDLPPESRLISADSLSGRLGCSIPHWAAVDLCKSLRTIVCSDRLPRRFQSDRYETFLRILTKVPEEVPLSLLRKQLIEGAIEGPDRMGERNISDVLESLNRDVDNFVLYEANDFREALKNSSVA